jgi:hypothetical protein
MNARKVKAFVFKHQTTKMYAGVEVHTFVTSTLVGEDSLRALVALYPEKEYAVCAE